MVILVVVITLLVPQAVRVPVVTPWVVAPVGRAGTGGSDSVGSPPV